MSILSLHRDENPDHLIKPNYDYFRRMSIGFFEVDCPFKLSAMIMPCQFHALFCQAKIEMS
jgi:hypothetical protein